MIRHFGLWLVVCAFSVTPVAADEDVHDGPTAIKPLTVTPQPQHTAPPNTVCDFQHQCYPARGGSMIPAPADPSDVVVRPVAPQSPPATSTADEPVVAAWRSCMGQALQNYEQSRSLHDLQEATSDCQMRLEEQGDQNLAGIDLPVPAAVPPHMSGRRNIGCGWWPIGSDADRDCAAGGHRF